MLKLDSFPQPRLLRHQDWISADRSNPRPQSESCLILVPVGTGGALMLRHSAAEFHNSLPSSIKPQLSIGLPTALLNYIYNSLNCAIYMMVTVEKSEYPEGRKTNMGLCSDVSLFK